MEYFTEPMKGDYSVTIHKRDYFDTTVMPCTTDFFFILCVTPTTTCIIFFFYISNIEILHFANLRKKPILLEACKIKK